MNFQRRYLETLTFCPNTGRQVSGQQFTFQTTALGKAVWWRCSACQRWHLLEVEANHCSAYPQFDSSRRQPLTSKNSY